MTTLVVLLVVLTLASIVATLRTARRDGYGDHPGPRSHEAWGDLLGLPNGPYRMGSV